MKNFSTWLGLRDLPVVDRDRQSERRGIYVVGDLADAPILKAALQQGDITGRHVADKVAGAPRANMDVDVVIAGGGPAGMAAAAALHERGISYLVLERDAPFHTIDAFPVGKVMYADPPGVPVPEAFPFKDLPKEDLVADWRARVDTLGLRIENGDLTEIEGDDGAFVVHTATRSWRARKVVLAFGRRGTPRRLDVPGSELASDHLKDPAAWRGKDVVVIGAGDSAVEAACSLAESGARATLLVRGERLSRPKPKNRARLAKSAVTVRLGVRITRVVESGVVVEGDAEPIPTDAVFALIGTELPFDLLRRCGVRLRSDPWRELARAPGLVLFALLTYAFYVLKQHRELWPFGDGPLGWLSDAVKLPLPWYPTADGSVRVLDAGFWGTALYSLAILTFGLDAMRRHRGPEQQRRYRSLIAFQWVFLFGIPEVVAPILTRTPGKLYSLSVPWPLSVWSLAHEPAAWGWLVAGALVSFVALPIYVARNNEKFCSYLCGCGGLAETVGDRFRWRAPRGSLAKKAEWGGPLVLACAIPVTLLLLNDMWGLVGFHTWLDQTVSIAADAAVIGPAGAEVEGAMRITEATVAGDVLTVQVEKFDWDHTWHTNGWIREVHVGDAVLYPTAAGEGRYTLPVADVAGPLQFVAASSSLSRATDFARHWYTLMVDFGLASLVGVAFYPWLGNRVWCRFFCPLRAYMEAISRVFGRLAIAPNEKCISCGECTKACQMGIDVQGFAEQGAHLDNVNSACIQCGLCVEACPLDVLSLVDKREAGLGPGPKEVGNW